MTAVGSDNDCYTTPKNQRRPIVDCVNLRKDDIKMLTKIFPML